MHSWLYAVTRKCHALKDTGPTGKTPTHYQTDWETERETCMLTLDLTKLCARPTAHRHKRTGTNIGNQWVDVRPQTGAAPVFVTECKKSLQSLGWRSIKRETIQSSSLLKGRHFLQLWLWSSWAFINPVNTLQSFHRTPEANHKRKRLHLCKG